MKISELTQVRAPGFIEIYVNNANAGFSFQDLRLIFSQVVIDRDNPYVEDRAAITMNWEHAKALRDLLDRLVSQYETDVGEIRAQPPDR
ncbi:MAG: DUF3467 domain-containing protein [Acidobacteria bacterium]|nr:DUF3467 domain-containing protein [Acidobacteriota bacterium]